MLLKHCRSGCWEAQCWAGQDVGRCAWVRACLAQLPPRSAPRFAHLITASGEHTLPLATTANDGKKKKILQAARETSGMGP